MMTDWKKIISIALKVPIWIFILASFGGSIYAAAYEIQGITWSTPAIMGAIILAYLISIFIDWKYKND